MNKDLRDKWCEMLRNPATKQVYGAASKLIPEGRGYCALGVFGLVLDWKFPIKSGRFVSTQNEVMDGVFAAARVAGLSCEQTYTILKLNDRCHWPFPMIADWIEQNIPVS